MSDSVVFVTEPLLSTHFTQYQVTVPLLNELARHFDVWVAAPGLSERVRIDLDHRGIRSISGGVPLPPPRHSHDEAPSYLLSWLGDGCLHLNTRALDRQLRDFPGLRVNYSMTTACQADLWYIQSGTLERALREMRPSVDPWLGAAIGLTRSVVGNIDWHHLRRSAARSRALYSSSRNVADLLRSGGIPVAGVLPMYCPGDFRPTTSSPSSDYVLTYLGKETDTEALRRLIRTGLPIKIFGAKSAGLVQGRLRDDLSDRVEVLGRVDHEQLCDLYTNAAFTAFPFTIEEFGLVPVESMACGTPVLTYDRQGPGETVLPNETGWLVSDSQRFTSIALDRFERGTPSWMRAACRGRAACYDLEAISQRWVAVLESTFAGESPVEYLDAPAPAPIPEARTGPRAPGPSRTRWPAWLRGRASLWRRPAMRAGRIHDETPRFRAPIPPSPSKFGVNSRRARRRRE